MAGITDNVPELLILGFIPFTPEIRGIPINVHLILEYLAFFAGFRYYLVLQKKTDDPISFINRLSIIIGMVFGALLGSRFFAFLEDPAFHLSQDWLHFINNKTIMGGLFGGLLGVELSKKIIGEKRSSGDLFTLPIILGLIIGRVGCFLAGTTEFTYGKKTGFFMGMDLGDGVLRHPIALYEILFLSLLFLGILHLQKKKWNWKPGGYFILFMLAYFSFRFFIEFLKPNTFLIAGLSSIQYLCLLCFFYYRNSISELITRARK